MIKDLKFIHFLTISSIIEMFILFLFKFTNQTSYAIVNWYHNLGWTAVILDILSEMGRDEAFKRQIYESVKKIIRLKLCLNKINLN